MSSTILRRNSSKQGLQNLTRLTAQWSVEDEEEAARERRRREREKQLRSQAEEGLNGIVSCSESTALAQENHYDFSPSGTLELEEDEGFSDWSQKLKQCEQRSPRLSYKEDSGVGEALVKLEQIQVDQESPQENMATREEERLYQEEEEAQEQEEKKRRRNEEEKEEETPEKRRKTPSLSSLEEEELCSDDTAVCSTKITDRTESQHCSIQKSNILKKSRPPFCVSKITDRLEQYTQAAETSIKNQKPFWSPSLDLPITNMMVANTKRLWETEEVTAQPAAKPSASKDIVPGDMSKRSLWEQKGSPTCANSVKSIPSGKRYKFVATGHGRYEKVLIDDDAEQ